MPDFFFFFGSQEDLYSSSMYELELKRKKKKQGQDNKNKVMTCNDRNLPKGIVEKGGVGVLCSIRI